MSLAIEIAERGWVPDYVLQLGIRRLLKQRLNSRDEAPPAFDEGPLAVHTVDANAQHYELPPEFFGLFLGQRLKYSACLYEAAEDTLARAEERMLALTCERACIGDGMSVLDLGCGWGSLSLWMAAKYPASEITAVSNSRPQAAFIRARALEQGLRNVTVETADINRFRPERRFDRVVSVEMFEHVRNYAVLLHRIHDWLLPGGELFVHIFCHRNLAYAFDTRGAANWMGRHFFTGGTMPSWDLLLQFDKHMVLEERWKVNGLNYARTCQHWLDNLDAHTDEALALLAAHYGKGKAQIWLQRWRMFLLACRELFAYRNGEEWLVGHYRFERRSGP